MTIGFKWAITIVHIHLLHLFVKPCISLIVRNGYMGRSANWTNMLILFSIFSRDWVVQKIEKKRVRFAVFAYIFTDIQMWVQASTIDWFYALNSGAINEKNWWNTKVPPELYATKHHVSIQNTVQPVVLIHTEYRV